MRHIEKESGNKFGNEKRCRGESWREFLLKTILSNNKREYMKLGENDFNMKTKIWGTLKEFSRQMTHQDRKGMNDY